MTNISFPGGTTREIVYWDGPELSGWGQVVGRFQNGDPAIVQDFVGRNHGFVMISGVHPEAPLDWEVPGYTSNNVSQDNSYAKNLISAALNKMSLSYF